MRRLLALALTTGLLPVALPLAAARAAEPAPQDDVVVTSVVREADGGLAFVHRTADTRAEGEELADRLEDRRNVVTADVGEPVGLLATANDTHRGEQWGLTRLGAESLWAEGDGSGVVVAVVDTGVDGQHPDLAGRVLAPVDLIDRGATTAVDPHGHGTHVAGTVAALTGNGKGVASLSPGARVLPVRALDASGSGYDSLVAEGVVKAVDRGADVVNLSLGGPSSSSVLREAVAYAISRGVVVVAAAGNSGPTGPVEYPAALPGVLGVGATALGDGVASFSTHGPHVDLVAPGAGIWSTWPDSRLARQSGTSMAAPFVAAAAALVLSTTTTSVVPGTVAGLLVQHADDLGPLGRDNAYGAGMLDVAGLRGAVRPVVVAPAPVPPPSVVTQPAPVAVAPAPPAPTTPAPTTPAPTTPAPTTPAPTTPAPTTPAPTSPAPSTPAPTTAAPTPEHVWSGRLSATARPVRVRQAVPVWVRALDGGAHAPGARVVLQRRTATGWATLRTGTAGPNGLVGWVLRPDATLTVRAVVGTGTGAGATPLATITVRRGR